MKQAGLPLLAKKILDRTVAAGVLVATAPILATAAIAVRVRLGKPVVFSQIRPGLHAKPFRIYKMRTMTDARDANGQLRPDSQRLTPLGRCLRSTSIDELPQLWNVLKGELSLVGPRPLLTEYLPLYTKEQARRHDVLPGVTSPTQVRGRNAISWEEKFAHDIWYVDNWSLWLDIETLAKTAVSVIKREGISHAGEATMPKFRGSAAKNATPN